MSQENLYSLALPNDVWLILAKHCRRPPPPPPPKWMRPPHQLPFQCFHRSTRLPPSIQCNFLALFISYCEGSGFRVAFGRESARGALGGPCLLQLEEL